MLPADPRLEERFELFLGNVLRIGVLLAASVVLFGAVLFLIRHGGEPIDHETFRGEPADLRHPAAIFAQALRFDGRGLILLGLLLLVATPVSRVVFSVFGFARERDFLYVALTLVVLGTLLYSLLASWL